MPNNKTTNNMYTIIIFSQYHNEWQEIMNFHKEEEAQKWVDEYPRFGAMYSRAIREGNWQIIKPQGK
jgi:hypothetical protein